MLIKVIESEYLTGDSEVSEYLEMFKDVYIFGIHAYRRILNSTNKSKMSQFVQEKRKRIGLDVCDENEENKT